MIANLHAPGFDNNSLNLDYALLSEREEKDKHKNYGRYKIALVSAGQFSILGALLFNFCMCNIIAVTMKWMSLVILTTLLCNL